jgi:hypothetical protein
MPMNGPASDPQTISGSRKEPAPAASKASTAALN